jgi:ATP-dependent helicase/nuclease subunit B
MIDVSRIFTISPGRPFLDALATQVLEETSGDPLALGRYTILLPTRRACRAIGEAFLRVGGGRALVLPALRPIGEVDEDQLILDEALGIENPDIPPAVPGLRRQLLLTRLILQWPREDRDITLDQAARLAAELSHFLDQVQTERLSFEELATLVPEDYSAHWQETLDFLKILTDYWPAILADDGALDPAERRNQVLSAQAEAWTNSPPDDPVIAAGSTGSIPATAELLAVVAGLSKGRVVLPGLQRDVDEDDLAAIAREQTHPQNGMVRLLTYFGVKPEQVEEWPSEILEPPRESVRLVAEVLRAAETSDAWRNLPALARSSLPALERIDCADEGEEAGVIALKLRHALEIPGRTAALVTPDRNLARRVAAELLRWGIEIDDSGGQALGDTAPGTFLRLILEAASTSFSPVALLALLKHPLAVGGLAPGVFRAKIRELEKFVLRGPRPGAGVAGLRAVLLDREKSNRVEGLQVASINALLEILERCVQPLSQAMMENTVPFSALIELHLAATELLSASDELDGSVRLWAGDAGEALAIFFAELHQSADVLPEIHGSAYAALLDSLMSGQVVRPKFGRHPRLNILGPLEARLQRADLTILGGLNEGTWPPEPTADPWMSRPMRTAFGLPLPERRIGLAAHDFAQAFCADEVVLTRARKVDGTPTVPSRWLVRLDTVLVGSGLDPNVLRPSNWQGWCRALNLPQKPLRIAAPAPRPPLYARPRRLSVTRIETWIRDPYAIYARYILGLVPIDPLEADPGAAERGIFIHEALESFLKEEMGPPQESDLARLLAHGERAFGQALSKPSVRAFWWPRFERIAEWFLRQERSRAEAIERSIVEVKGKLEIDAPFGPFTLTATADRIDLGTDGHHTVIDYKTGAVPTNLEVMLGFSPQLPLEAAIAAAGGFPGISEATTISDLAYWRLTGGEPAGEVRRVGGDATQLAADALEGLRRLVAVYDDESTPYLAVPNPIRAMRYNDYLHLARVQEWSSIGAEDAGL